ncbi:hypothetical protein B484DRAFT_427148 [Ochromonadaceae sp. CCMP2298]|nr:hypothetical protein B484DRAFT_427148 [Ochromonadaceae sp. CCMP2298]
MGGEGGEETELGEEGHGGEGEVGESEGEGEGQEGPLCSVFETTCNLISVLSGSGMLSLPFAAAQTGWAAMLLLLLLGCIFMYSFTLLALTVETRYKQVVFPQLSTTTATLMASLLSCLLALLDLKSIAFSSVIGLCLTGLVLVAILLTGLMGQGTNDLGSGINDMGTDISGTNDITRSYSLFSLGGMPVSMGLMAFCFGGHGTL